MMISFRGVNVGFINRFPEWGECRFVKQVCDVNIVFAIIAEWMSAFQVGENFLELFQEIVNRL